VKLICIEEHATDLGIAQAAEPALQREAPYIWLQNSHNAAPQTRTADRPTVVDMAEVQKLAPDLGNGRIRNMDQHGIDMQVISYSSPAQLVPLEQSLALTRAANNRLAAAINANPTRLSGFAVLPWQVPHAAADELDRAITELGLKGVLIVGRPGATFLDDPRYTPVLQKLNDLQVPIYVHPFYPLPQVQQPYYGGLAPEVSAQFSLAGWGWHHEAGIHVLRLILSGIFERFPNLQVISGHWGEMVPFYLHRLDDMMPPRLTGLPATITDTYRQHVWVTPSGMFYLPHFEFIRDVIGLDRLIWAVDYPYLSLDGTRKFVENLPITDDQKHDVAHRNAEALFGL
jgi:uncharacterized protein